MNQLTCSLTLSTPTQHFQIQSDYQPQLHDSFEFIVNLE